MTSFSGVEDKIFIILRNKILKPTATKYSIIAIIYLDLNAYIFQSTFKMTHILYSLIYIEGNLGFYLNFQQGVVVKYVTSKGHFQNNPLPMIIPVLASYLDLKLINI